MLIRGDGFGGRPPPLLRENHLAGLMPEDPGWYRDVVHIRAHARLAVSDIAHDDQVEQHARSQAARSAVSWEDGLPAHFVVVGGLGLDAEPVLERQEVDQARGRPDDDNHFPSRDLGKRLLCQHIRRTSA